MAFWRTVLFLRRKGQRRSIPRRKEMRLGLAMGRVGGPDRDRRALLIKSVDRGDPETIALWRAPTTRYGGIVEAPVIGRPVRGGRRARVPAVRGSRRARSHSAPEIEAPDRQAWENGVGQLAIVRRSWRAARAILDRARAHHGGMPSRIVLFRQQFRMRDAARWRKRPSQIALQREASRDEPRLQLLNAGWLATIEPVVRGSCSAFPYRVDIESHHVVRRAITRGRVGFADEYFNSSRRPCRTRAAMRPFRPPCPGRPIFGSDHSSRTPLVARPAGRTIRSAPLVRHRPAQEGIHRRRSRRLPVGRHDVERDGWLQARSAGRWRGRLWIHAGT